MKKVITYGTFDLFHQGHYNIIKRAKEYGDYLIVGVTSESYDIERGKLSVQDSLVKRIENVKNTGLVDEIIVEEYLGQKVRDIIKYNIDIFVIGTDWLGKFEHLKKFCQVVYLERTRNISSTQLREENSHLYRIGIVTENMEDASLVAETTNVSGLHIESVFSEKIDIANRFCDKYCLGGAYDDYVLFLEDNEIIYIKVALAKRYQYIKKAIELGKHVICEAPFTLNGMQYEELQCLASSKGVVLAEDIIMIYLRAFNQLIWLSQSGAIGDVLNVKCSISHDILSQKNNFLQMALLAVCAIAKIMGIKDKGVHKLLVKDEAGQPNYCSLVFDYERARACVDIGVNTEFENMLVIVGSKGTITLKDDWWNTGYFELKEMKTRYTKKYCFNFEGTGLRYILQEVLIMIRDNKSELTRLFPDEIKYIVHILQVIL